MTAYAEMDAAQLRLEVARRKGLAYEYPDHLGNPYSLDWQCPRWSEDIAAAWGLVEEMGETNPVEVGTGAPYYCRVYDEQYVYTTLHKGEGDTAPIAICYAYIAWKDAQP